MVGSRPSATATIKSRSSSSPARSCHRKGRHEQQHHHHISLEVTHQLTFGSRWASLDSKAASALIRN